MLHDVFDDVTACFQIGTDSDHTELFYSFDDFKSFDKARKKCRKLKTIN